MPPAAPRFIKRPAEVTRVHEGHPAVLRCQTDRPFPDRTWIKGLNNMFRDYNFKQVNRNINVTSRIRFIGNLTANDYSIEINNVIPADEDTYACRAMLLDMDVIGHIRNWLVETRLEVIPTPPLTMPPSTEPGNSPTTIQEHHHYSPISNHLAASLESSAATSADSFGPPHASTSGKPLSNNNKAREAFPGARELDRNNQTPTGLFISPSSSAFMNNYNGHHHATVRASTSYPSISGSGSASLASAALVWPYLLLALAALLMLANVYLIFSLIKRHTRCSKENEAHEGEQDDESSMA